MPSKVALAGQKAWFRSEAKDFWPRAQSPISRWRNRRDGIF